MTKVITGGCLCGAVRYTAKRPPRHVVYCHFTMCRRASGSAFSMFVAVKADEFEFTKGEPKVYQSSEFAERGFCGDGGSPLFFRCTHGSEWISPALGSLDAPEETPPTNHFGIESILGGVSV